MLSLLLPHSMLPRSREHGIRWAWRLGCVGMLSALSGSRDMVRLLVSQLDVVVHRVGA